MKYQVLTTSRALEDIRELLEYIQTSFAEPQIASRMKESIIDAIDSLSEFPLRNPISQDETLHQQGIRKMMVKNYYIIYHVVGENVIILRVLYNRREWQDLL